MNIQELDKNFIINSVNLEEYEFHSFNEFSLEGFPWFEENNEFIRLPKRILKNIREELAELSYSCAGGAVRFNTNSSKIAIRCKLRKMRYSSGMPLAADAGIDLYCGKEFVANYRPEVGTDSFCSEADTYSIDNKDYTIYLPLYSGIEVLEIGFLKGSRFSMPSSHKINKPVLFYGSSITNGGCASRPGLIYPAIITRNIDAELINLGFSGNALGDIEIANAITEIDPSMIILEYDHNSPNEEHLEMTHKPFFECIRNSHKYTPILIMSRCYFNSATKDITKCRKRIIEKTYTSALENGDKNVYFYSGMDFFSKNVMTDCTVDLIHPNDRGFAIMAEKIQPIIEKALNI